MSALRLYGFWLPLAVLVVLTIWVLAQSKAGFVAGAVLFILGVAGAIGLALLIVAWRFYRDLGALADNAYGLCTGRGQTSGDEGLVEWLHQGIQRSAGRGRGSLPESAVLRDRTQSVPDESQFPRACWCLRF